MSTLKSDCDGNLIESIYGSYSFVHDPNLPCKGNSSSFDVQRLADSYFNGHAKSGRENQLINDFFTAYAKNDTFFPDVPLKYSHSHNKNNGDSWLQEFESTVNDDLLSNVLLSDLDSSNCLLFERPKKICSDLDSHWIGLKKLEPWWHAVEKDNLGSLIRHVEKVSDNSEICFDKFEEQVTDNEKKLSCVTGFVHRNLASVRMDKSVGKCGLMDGIQESNGTFSSRENSSNTSKVDSSDKEPSGDLSRSQLLEALCHSQTRAREAEKLAQKACDEKDHIINLFFQQASCLFAYRQWLHLLQLETLCLHLRGNNQNSSVTSPVFGTRVQTKGTLRKNRPRAEKMKPGKTRCIGKCAIAFAIGFGLASAGLLVGWTIGWLFPAL